ncbi:MAG TPA: nucleotide exchange factor GrpE [Candidatus Lokiarchaeia archaeon]
MPKKEEKKEVKQKEEINEKNNEIKDKKADQKLIEDKEGAEKKAIAEKKMEEQKLLEYYSKEELVERIRELQINLKIESEKSEEFKKWKDKSVHLQAEFENAQKRWDKSRQALTMQNTASVLKNFLPLYDSFKNAIESKNNALNDTLTPFYKQFMSILKNQGAEPISVKINDRFDYSIHEALSSTEKDDIPENCVIEIIQDGWKLGKEVLRYAKVVLSKKPKPPEPEPTPEKEKEILEDTKDKTEDQDKKAEEKTDKGKNGYFS